MKKSIIIFSSLFLVAACGKGNDDPKITPDPEEEAGPLMAGMATIRIPAPLGIGTSGYGPFDVPSSRSPFAEIYPATTRLHSHPEIRVVVLHRGPGAELVFVRLDTVGVFQQLRYSLVLELEKRLGRNLDDALILGATHTHSGPGRIIPEGGLFDLVADTFFPEYYERMIDALASAVEMAYEDLGPARAGFVMGDAPGANSNRRCEDGSDYTNSSVPVIAVERDDRIEALILAFAVHGTALGIRDLTLSREVPGAIEHAVEERFEHPVQVLMFTSWAGDMSPGDPDITGQSGAELPRGYDRMEKIGLAVADAVERALSDLETDDEPLIDSRTVRTGINRELIGYDDDIFPYPYGGLYCGGESDCDPSTIVENLDKQCIAFPFEQPAPDQTEFSFGRMGDLFFVTFTGEPLTSLAEYVMDGMKENEGVNDVMFFGYTQDFLGYSLLEHDWWLGGYEASGTLWGPGQGEFLADFLIEAFSVFMSGDTCPSYPGPWPPVTVGDYEKYMPDRALDFGELLVDVENQYVSTDIVSVTVAGSDPWLGAPLAFLETADGQPVRRPGGQPVDSDGYYFWLDLITDPPYEQPASERRFEWTFNLPLSRQYGTGGPVLEGSYRLRIMLPSEDGEEKTVISGVFEVGG